MKLLAAHLSLLLAGLLAACDEAGMECDPGQSVSCTCASGIAGEQVCLPGGSGWEECQCCQPDCEGMECGDSGCGTVCGVCAASEHCNAQGQCECAPDCLGAECGPDGCGGSCGVCQLPYGCQPDGSCSCCASDCTGRECGDDGAGGSCGTCEEWFVCSALGTCMPTERQSGDPCTFGVVHADSGQCIAGLDCIGFHPEVESLPCPDGDSDCIDLMGSTYMNPVCVDGGCGASFCAAPCVDGHCPNCGVTIHTMGECYCDPWLVGEPATGTTGDECVWDVVHADSCTWCSTGMECVGMRPDPATMPCSTDVDCLAFVQGNWNPDCVDGGCGASFCSPECVAGQCDHGFAPVTIGDRCFCVPDQQPGEQAAGEPCAFDQVHADTGDCLPGLRCLGLPPDPEQDPCPNGDGDCAQIMDPLWNPDCVEGGCGASFCSPPCDDGACECGFAPVPFTEGCYCFPEAPRSPAAGERCPFGAINTEGCEQDCPAGMVCIGEAADPVNRRCIGDTACLAFFPVSWNVDCENGGCGMSFCAEECDGNGACAAGFEPFDVGGTCYCRPMP